MSQNYMKNQVSNAYNEYQYANEQWTEHCTVFLHAYYKLLHHHCSSKHRIATITFTNTNISMLHP